MKDYIPLVLFAGLLAPAAPALAQDFAAAPGKTRVTLYFKGSEPVAPPRLQPVSERLAPSVSDQADTATLVQAVSPSSERQLRYLTPEEWARHPANRAAEAIKTAEN